MGVQVSYPGVYIEEFAPAPPIQGVGTSTAAFLGVAAKGQLNTPVLITSWDLFRQTFGDQPVTGFFLWYAVRGFFENGGQLCYVVRISNANAAALPLNDHGGQPTLTATAMVPGTHGNSMTVQTTATAAIQSATAYRHRSTISGVAAGTKITVASVDEAALFRPGDNVIVEAAPAQRATVVSVSGKDVSVSQPLPAAAAGQELRLDDLLAATDRVLRLSLTIPRTSRRTSPRGPGCTWTTASTTRTTW